MKDKRLLTLALAVALLLPSACDKISSDQYTLFDGQQLGWAAGLPIEAPAQRALVEKFTGPRCTNCPLADQTLDEALRQLGDALAVISVNSPTGQGEPYPGQPDMRTDAGSAWADYYGVSAIPDAYLNRNKATGYQGSMDNITADIRAALQSQPTVAVEVEASGSPEIRAVVNVQLLADIAQTLTLTVAIVEDSLVYLQAMPVGSPLVRDSNYVHNHMLRQVVTGPWGSDIPAEGQAGECLAGTLLFQLADGLRPDRCHLVAFVSDKESRRVLNCATCKIPSGE